MVMGLAIFLGGAKAADGINRVATPVLLALFCSLFFVGVQEPARASSQLAFADWGAFSSCLPISFLALVFHDLVPVLASYLQVRGALEG